MRRLLSLAPAVVLATGLLAFAWAGPLTAPAAAATPAGFVVAWGSDKYQTTDVPAAAQSGVVAISAGVEFALALKSNGTVIAWGSNTYGETDVPAAAQSSVVAISAGCRHALALKSNGAIVAWGDTYHGMTDVPALPSGFRYTAVAAGCYHSLALMSSSTIKNRIVAWGDNYYLQTNVPVVYVGPLPFPIWGLKAIDGGDTMSLAIKSDGTVVAWGTNTNAQMDVPTGLSNVTAVSTGSLAIKSDGTVVAWGTVPSGMPAGLSKVKAISTRFGVNLALKSDGTVVAWGRNDYGQTKVPAGASGASAVSAGQLFSLALVPQTAPAAPTVVVATASDGAASVSWNAPAGDGHSPITGYTVTSSPGGKTCSTTGATSCNVGGLANGTAYTFTARAKNAIGTGPASAPSVAVTPSAAATPSPSPSPSPSVAASASPGAGETASSSPAASTAPGGSTGSGGGTDAALLIALVLVGVALLALAAGIALLAAVLWRRGRVAGPPGTPPNPAPTEPPHSDVPPSETPSGG